MIPNVHDPKYWHEELQPLLVDLDFALKIATPRAHAVFAEYLQKPVNRPLLSNLIRYFVLDYLRSRGHSAAEIEEDPDIWGLNGLPNNGIEIVYRRACIRIRKGTEVPCPNTQSQREFYQQRFCWGDDEDNDSIATNLILMWNLNRELQYKGSMNLMRPIRGNAKWVKLEWSKQVVVRSIDPETTVRSDYAHSPDMPIGSHQNLDTGTNNNGNKR